LVFSFLHKSKGLWLRIKHIKKQHIKLGIGWFREWVKWEMHKTTEGRTQRKCNDNTAKYVWSGLNRTA